MSLEGKQLGRYHLRQLIGSGGMGEVYLAEDVQVRRQVAAKVIRIEEAQPGNESTASALRLFLREATAIARLDNPNILPLYDYGEERRDNAHFAYLITPYRSEGSLVNWLRRRSQDQNTWQLTLKQVVHIIQQAADALQYAHEQQVVHQDVKPANFLIRNRSEGDEYPDLQLADFGIALLVSTTTSASQNLRGTPVYMAPEQWAGKAVFASDQYALAVMAYELLAGRTPFQGSAMNMMYAHLHEQPKSPREFNSLLPAAINDVLQRALAKSPADRFASVAAFASAFQAAFQNIDANTTLRMLPSSPATPQVLTPQSSGDIRATLAINREEAYNGASRVLTLPGGRQVNVQIPPRAQSGQVLTLAGLGETLNGGAPGNLYLSLSIVETQSPISVTDTGVDLTYRTSVARSLTPIPDANNLPTVAGTGQAGQQGGAQPFAPTMPTVQGNTRTGQQIVLQPFQNNVPAVPTGSQTGTYVVPAGREQRSPVRAVLLVLLVLVLLGGGGFGVYYASTTGVFSEHRGATGSDTPPVSTQRASNNATATAKATAAIPTATATAQPTVNVNATATAIALIPGNIWTTVSPISSYTLNGVASSGSLFVAVGDNGTILVSANGQNWTDYSSASGTQQRLNAVIWDSSLSLFVVAGDNDIILTSHDGKSWTLLQPSGADQNLHGIGWSNSMLVVVGDSGTFLLSSDGQNWQAIQSSIVYSIENVWWAYSQFVAVGNNGRIFTSPDGHTWTDRSLSGNPATLPNLVCVRSGAGFIAVGGAGTIVTSANGKQWYLQNSGTQQNLWGLSWSEEQFVVVGNGGTILHSSDGQNWTAANSSVQQDLRGIAWSGGQFVAVGSGGVVLTSP